MSASDRSGEEGKLISLKQELINARNEIDRLNEQFRLNNRFMMQALETRTTNQLVQVITNYCLETFEFEVGLFITFSKLQKKASILALVGGTQKKKIIEVSHDIFNSFTSATILEKTSPLFSAISSCTDELDAIVVCPIFAGKQNFGLLICANTLANKQSFNQIRPTVLPQLNLFSKLSSHPLEVIKLNTDLRKSNKKLKKLVIATERFVPKRFLHLLKKRNLEDVQIGDSVKRDVTAMFADIRDFTTLSETLTPELTSQFLNIYMNHMAPIIRKHNGLVQQFLGDGILALFPESPDEALLASLDMTSELTEFHKEIEQLGFAQISMGIGLNFGDAMICVLGEKERIEASVVSDAINTASRIEGLNKFYGTQLLISEAVYRALRNPEQFLLCIVDNVILKGKTQGTRIYEVLTGTENAVRPYINNYQKAFIAYEKGDFAKAIESFDLCLQHYPNKQAPTILKARCLDFLATGAPPHWDGTVKMAEK